MHLRRIIPHRRNFILSSSLLFVFFLTPLLAYGQMFSVGDTEETEQRPVGFYTNLAISWEPADFDYRGESLSPEEEASFSSNVIRFRLESPGLHLSFGVGGNLTGMDDTSYINLNATLFNDAPIVRSQGFILSIPVQIITDLKSSRLNVGTTNFQQNSLVFGTGLSARARVAERVDFTARATPNYGFSFSQGNIFGGNLFRTNGMARFYFNEIIGDNSLSIGYDFDYRNYNIEGDENDYRYLSHSITVGIAF